MRFADWLQSNTAADVLKSKTCGSDVFISISMEDTIWKAMCCLGEKDISAICVYSVDQVDSSLRTYHYILSINEILGYLCHYLKDNPHEKILDADSLKKQFLEISVGKVIEASQSKLTPIFIKEDLCLRELINIWIREDAYNTSHRVLVGTEHDVQDVLTITDFIHYCFVHAHQLPDIMQCRALSALYPGTKTPSSFSSSSLVDEAETTWSALNKLLQSLPIQVVGITESLTGNLVGYLSSMDFMPAGSPDHVFDIISGLKSTIATFIRLITKSPSRLIDAVTFRDHMNLEELIERLLKLRVHMLWRISFTGQVIGVVTAIDVLRYFKRCADLNC